MQPRPGTLLVASAVLADPNFAETVVLLIDADADGALGVVLNRPTPILVADVLEPWRDAVEPPEVLFRGGPVAVDGALALGRLLVPDDEPVGFKRAFGIVGLVDLDAPVEMVEGGLDAMRVFAGYAGWGPGQLEAEIAEGSWYVVPSEPGDLFREDTDTLRRDVLRRQPGDLAWAATRPADPLMN
ncbi:YqgE/AlgH family protein [Nocardioides sp. AE5]|uniref:YqgE/AlgH family protein n=1 Tax=Nocardioides sp. AE5 TaxID=2962573 RepID=UPI00288222CD|nr:YqgE/AlgH family protein [Nocardioides sp. AE5]MDT0201826.1 YqgE/AlgH family protein [Nocardioides sp. AE5]